ncbi:MAG: hypothetical protein KDA84_19265, partial [Planctomycetaceae bacterium]|nr:hypothetical protein [Planctomycetaceae bacterium]
SKDGTSALLPGTGHFKVDGLQIQMVSRLLSKTTGGRSLTGRLKVEFDWSPAESSKPTGSGSVELTGIKRNGRQLVNRFESQIQLLGNRIVVNNTRGVGAGGEMEVLLGAGSANAGFSEVRVQARSLDLKVISQFTPVADVLTDGRIDLEAHIIPQEIWRVDVHLRAQHLRVKGVSIQSVTLPIHGTILPSFERGELTMSSVAGSLAAGRIKGQIAVGWGDRRRIDGELKFDHIDTQLLVREAIGSDVPGDGKLSGTINLDGKNMASWSQTKVKFDAKLSRAQPRRLPIVQALQTVARSIAISQPIEEGRIKATYAQSQITVQSITLNGPTLEILIWGTVLSNNRLNLNAIIRTGRRSLDRRLAHLVGGNLGNRILGILADRLVQVRITGTTNRPIVNVKPLSLVNIKAKQ